MLRFFLLVRIMVMMSMVSVSASLQLSEVWFDGSDEWIEIINTDTDSSISGLLEITGVKTSDRVLSLPDIMIAPGEIFLIGDNCV